MLIIRDTDENFELQRDLSKMITNKNHNVDLAILSSKKFMFEFAKQINFVERALGFESARDKSVIRLFTSPAIMASGISTLVLPETLGKLCDGLKILLQEKQAGNNSITINGKLVAIADRLL